MRLLLTSDSQAEFSNLDLCEQSLGELLQAITKYKPDAVIHGGDLKEALNPVDIRVVKFWVRAVRRIVATGVPFFINLGNHDQIGQSVDSTHWLDVLRAAGARVAIKPRCVSVADGTLAFLPYTRDKKRELRWAQILAEEVKAWKSPSVLIFHTDVQGAVLTNYGTKVTVGNDVSALCFDSYTACFGGHLHQHQEVAGNGWYIGSPFCQDWGEANQRKGLLLWDSSWDEPKQFVTTIPHWYDAEYLADLPGLDGEPRQPEPGAYIRSRIEVTSKKITQQLRKEEDRLRKLYPDARLYVIPKLIQSEKLEVELTGSTDEERVSQYVAATVPEAARFDSREAVGYLASKLPTVRPGGSNAQLRIRKLEATNVLPFKEVALSYHKKGLVLLRGINRDWPKRSNGCIAAGTLIDVPRNLHKYPGGVPIEQLVGKENFWIYSQATNGVVLTKAAWCKQTGAAVRVVRICFRETHGHRKPRPDCLPWIGQIELTPEHLVMLRSGAWIEAQHLKPGDRLMPFYRSLKDGTYFAVNLNNGTSAIEHRFVLAAMYGERDTNYHGHHKNGKTYDNRPSNLEWKTRIQHFADHAKERRARGEFIGWEATGEHPRGMLGKRQSEKQRAAAAEVGSRPRSLGRLRRDRKACRERQLARWKAWGLTRSNLNLWYHKEGLNATAIAAKVGVSLPTVLTALRRYGLFVENNHVVESVELSGKTDVYDIHVPETNSFFANGICVHNSGKTSLLSLLTVAWAGETLKGQKNDAWAREDTDEKAVVKLYLRDDRGRSIEITRQRRPHGLWLTVDGVDQSTGLSGKGKQETQGQIEELTGFDLKMLINSVYIDQTVANGFVFGTQADRMNLVNKLCDLERFDTALKSIGADIKTNGGELTDCTRQIERLEQERGSLEEDIADLERESKESMPWTIMAEKTRASLKDLKKERAALASSEGYYTELQTEMDVWTQEVIDFDNKVRAAMVSIKQLEVDAARALKLINAKKCPTCGQEALVVGKELGTFVDKKMRQERETCRKWTEARIETQQKLEKAKASKQKYKDEVLTLDFQIEKGEDLLSQAQEGEKVESTRAAKLKGKLEAAQNKLAHNRQSEKAQRKQLKVLAVRGELLEYAQKACHRSGMPMYLAASLCPRLNQMAEEYSEIFTEGKMRVRFSVVDGEFVVDIVNPTGSESTKGQSVGESAMAGIIAAFALRETAPRTNLLVLDEPGHGLDSAGAKEFAKGLLRLRDSGRYETIIVTTHSPIIESVLEGVTVWEVRKQNGVATLSV